MATLESKKRRGMGPLSCGAVGVGPSEDLPRDGWILAAEWLAHAGVLSCLDGSPPKTVTAQAGRAVNISLTLRNWMIGCYIREYEQNGADRAQYGETLLGALSERLTEAGIEGMAARSLRLYRQFYLTYPQIWQTVSAKFPPGLLSEVK